MQQKNVHSLLVICIVLANLGSNAYAQAQKPINTSDELSPVQRTAFDVADASIAELPKIDDWRARIELSAGLVQLLRHRNPARARQLLDELFVDALEWDPSGKSTVVAGESWDVNIQSVIQIASSLDRALAQSYLEKYEESKRLKIGANETESMRPAVSAIDLAVATSLVEEDPLFAASVAERSLTSGIAPGTLIFLEKLRQKDRQLASNFFISAMAGIEARHAYNVNELFLFYSYIFSSREVPWVMPQGFVTQQIPEYQQIFRDHSIDLVLARQYLRDAIFLLSNPDRLTGRGANLTAGMVGDLYFLKVIEPKVFAYFPAMIGPLLNQESVLVSSIDSDRRTSLDENLNRWNERDGKRPADGEDSSGSVESLVRRADGMAESPQRDQVYYNAAMTSVGQRNYQTALSIVDKMSAAKRDVAKQFILFSIAEMNLKERKFDQAEYWARLDSDPVRRAYIFNEIAYELVQNRRTKRALELLGEVEQIAVKVEANREKAATLIGAAVVLSGVDEGRASELLMRAIHAANKDKTFTGDSLIYRSLDIGEFSFSYSMYNDRLALLNVVKRLGQNDFYQTFSIIQNLEGRMPRLRATLALCKAVIETRSAERQKSTVGPEKSTPGDTKKNGNLPERTKKRDGPLREIP